jgi:hypothetical protein
MSTVYFSLTSPSTQKMEALCSWKTTEHVHRVFQPDVTFYPEDGGIVFLKNVRETSARLDPKS